MSTVPVLVGVSGQARGRSYPVAAAGVGIGRHEENEIHIEDHGVSRRHAKVLIHNGVLWVQDLGSRNGVFVNDDRVQTHQQLKIGDRLTVGTHVFEVRAEVPPPEPSVVTPAPRKTGFKLWPFLVVGAVVLGLVVLVALAGSDGGRVADADLQDPEVIDLLRQAPLTREPASAGQAGAQERPAEAQAGQAEADNRWPPPPPGVTSPELVDKAHGLYRARRLHDALVAYHQARALDQDCEICDRRIERLTGEIEEAIQLQFDAGLRYYHNLQYNEAITAWQMVLLLSPDPESPAHQRAKAHLAQAERERARQF